LGAKFAILIDQYWNRRGEINWRLVNIADIAAVIDLADNTGDSRDT
jgi:hypothetical protein